MTRAVMIRNKIFTKIIKKELKFANKLLYNIYVNEKGNNFIYMPKVSSEA